MTKEVIAIIDSINVNKSHGEIAVYKPLLLLIIFGSVLNKKKNNFSFVALRNKLTDLMKEYGWKRKSKKRSTYPFSFLASSIIWELNLSKQSFRYQDAPTNAELENAKGKLNSKVYNYLLNNPNQNIKIIKYIENKFFDGRKIKI